MEDESIDGGLARIRQTDFSGEAAEFAHNKRAMFRILEENPKIGVYKNETFAEWQVFYQFFLDFLKSQIGPRGDCAKAIRQQLLAQQQHIDPVLAPFGQTAKSHIREIYMKIKHFVPCKQYTELLRIKEARDKFQVNLDRFCDESSEMVKAITDGLVKKHGADYDVASEIKRLKENYVKRVQQNNLAIEKITEIVNTHQSYHDLMNANKVLEPYFKLWVEADSSIGKENLKTGQLFQEKVFSKVLPYLLHRELNSKNWIHADKKLEVFTNLNWIPKNLGEIDIAFGYRDEEKDRYFIVTLIECKSRFFDLRQAYRQVSLDNQNGVNKGPSLEQLKQMKRLKQMSKTKTKSSKRQQPNQIPQEQSAATVSQAPVAQQAGRQGIKQKFNTKKFLSTKYGAAQLVQNHHFYIITTLPQNDFILPIESKMKQSIEKHTKNLFIEDIESEPLYQSLRERFEEVLSPLQWVREYEARWGEGESNIVVLR